MNFIKIDDSDLAEKMIRLGFQLIERTNGIWTFLNEERDTKMNFNKEEKKHLAYSDVLNI